MDCDAAVVAAAVADSIAKRVFECCGVYKCGFLYCDPRYCLRAINCSTCIALMRTDFVIDGVDDVSDRIDDEKSSDTDDSDKNDVPRLSNDDDKSLPWKYGDSLEVHSFGMIFNGLHSIKCSMIPVAKIRLPIDFPANWITSPDVVAAVAIWAKRCCNTSMMPPSK